MADRRRAVFFATLSRVFDALPAAIGALGFRPSRVFAMGRSLGSAAALEIADCRGDQLAGLILESGFAFTGPLLARFGLRLDGYEEDSDGYGNARKIARFARPTLIIHGKEDRLIPPDEATALLNHSAELQKRLILVEGGSHNDLMFRGHQEYFEALRSFIWPE